MTVPTPEDYVKCAARQIGYDAVISPWPPTCTDTVSSLSSFSQQTRDTESQRERSGIVWRV